MNHRVFVASAAVLVTLVACAGAAPAAPAVPATRPGSRPDVKSLLEKPLPEVRFVGTPLEEAIKSLSGTAQVNVVPNWRDLEAAGVKRDAKVTVSARDVKAADALRRVLASAGPKARFGVEQGVVYVATEAELARRAMVVGKGSGGAQANEAAARALARGVPGVKLEGVQLDDALNFCRDQMSLPLDVDWEALKRAGVAPETRVTLELKNAAAGDVLYWLLRPLPAKAPIECLLKDGKLVVGARAPAEKP